MVPTLSPNKIRKGGLETMPDKSLSREEVQEWVRKSREFYEENQRDLGEPIEDLPDLVLLGEHAKANIDIIVAEDEWGKYRDTWFEELREVLQAIDQLKSE